MKTWACFFGLHDWEDFAWSRLETFHWWEGRRLCNYRANRICMDCEKLDLALDRARAELVAHEEWLVLRNAALGEREALAKKRATYLLALKEKAKER